MAMRSRNKATAWKRDGKKGRIMSKRMANVLERREAKNKEQEYVAREKAALDDESV